MRRQLGKMCIRPLVWLFSEVVFSLVGLDNLADYSEFIFEAHHKIAHASLSAIVYSVDIP
ncbi:MAG: hypothetical protein ACTS3T_01810 [Almyronema sp.]